MRHVYGHTMKAAERQLQNPPDVRDPGLRRPRRLCAANSTLPNPACAAISTFWKQEGVLKRVYGGAVSVQAPPSRAFDYAVESVRLSDEKSRIARLTASLIEDGQTVILDGGSTVAAVARELASKSLHIVTNSLPIAESLESLRNIELTLTGGYLDPRLRVMLGPFCEQMLGAIRADARDHGHRQHHRGGIQQQQHAGGWLGTEDDRSGEQR